MKTEPPDKISALEEDVLTVLLNRELYGLEMLKILNRGRRVPMKLGSLYSTLKSLKTKKLADWHYGDEQQDTGGGRRKYYRLTESGRTALKDLRQYRLELEQLADFSYRR
jgi:DNA-binding PadR family transcriptional regulator